MAKKRQTFGKLTRERARLEKRERKLEKKEERKQAAEAEAREAEATGEAQPDDVADVPAGDDEPTELS